MQVLVQNFVLSASFWNIGMKDSCATMSCCVQKYFVFALNYILYPVPSRIIKAEESTTCPIVFQIKEL